MLELFLGKIEGDSIAVLAIGGGFVIAILSIITGTIQRIMVTRQREQSRREIAAYVAEGSITPDDASKLIAAGGSVREWVKNRMSC